MSSWLCPEDKKDNWHPLSFFKAIWKAKCLRRQLFLHSLLQLSAWTCSIICRKSTLRSMDKVVRAELKISADLELLVERQCCVKTVNAICPCTSTEVHAILGRAQLQNSLDSMVLLFGQLYFAMSMESSIAQISWGHGLTESSRLWDLWYQYTRRSASCLAKCFCSSSYCARRAGPQCPSFFIIRRCLTHWAHLAWWVWNRIRSRSENSRCHT